MAQFCAPCVSGPSLIKKAPSKAAVESPAVEVCRLLLGTQAMVYEDTPHGRVFHPLVDAPDEGAFTALHTAADKGTAGIVSALLGAKASASIREWETGSTPLQLAVCRDRDDAETGPVVTALLGAKAAVTGSEAVRGEGYGMMTPRGFSVRGSAAENETPGKSLLHMAVEKGNLAVLQALLKAKAEPDMIDEEVITLQGSWLGYLTVASNSL